MRYGKILVLGITTAALGTALALQVTAPARAAAPIVRTTYQGIGSGVNESVAVIWLLGSDGAIKICTHGATNVNADAPICSAPVTP